MDVVIAPPAVYLESASKSFAGGVIQVAAQNISDRLAGAFTGEISAAMLVDLGVPWVIVGHSERRQIFGEGSEEVGRKLAVGIEAGLSVIACIGETLAERESGQTMAVLASQLEGLKGADVKDWSRVVIAYEPVWAIGTGMVATPQQAQETHSWIRGWIEAGLGEETAKTIRIIYGGSVNEGNCKDLLGGADIDGFLVGGASLKPAQLMQIVCITASE